MLDTAAQVAALGVVLWVFTYQLPKARREQDTFAVICSLLTALVALGFMLVVGIGLHSRV
jgi:hypothetical protein